MVKGYRKTVPLPDDLKPFPKCRIKNARGPRKYSKSKSKSWYKAWVKRHEEVMRKTALLIIILLLVNVVPFAYAEQDSYKYFDKIDKWTAKAEKTTGYVTIDKDGKQVKFKLINQHTPIYLDESGKAKHIYSDILTETYLVPDGLEYMIILNKKPSSNTFSIEIDSLGMSWYYQPPMSEGWEYANDTHAWDKDGNELAYRPIEAVGSYAVYDGGAKFMHVYRPWVYDSGGVGVWGSLNYTDGVLTVLVPVGFLDSAKYPVYVDPTFGYTTAGASGINIQNTRIIWDNATFSAPGSNLATSITAYLSNDNGATHMCALYSANGGTYEEKTETWVKNVGAGWHTFTLNSMVGLANGSYAFGVWSNDGSSTYSRINYDNGGDNCYYDGTSVYANWPGSLTISSTYANFVLSMYVNYTTNYAPTALNVSTASIFSKDEYNILNITVMDQNGVDNINYVDATIYTLGDAENFTLRWVQSTDTFSEYADPDGICTLDAPTSFSTELNDTVVTLSFNLTMTGGLSGDCDIHVLVVDDGGLNSTTVFNDAFEFSYFNWQEEVYDLINSAFGQFGIIDYMSSITELIESFATYFDSSITRLITLVTQQFRIINSVIGWFTYWATAMIDIVLDFSEFYHELLDGTSVWSDALEPYWDLLMMMEPIFPLAFFIWWIDSISTRARYTVGGELQVFVNDINTAISLLSYFTNIFLLVINTVIDRVYGLFDALI